MSEAVEAPVSEDTATAGLTPEEQAAVEVGKRGFAEPTNVNTPAETGPQRPDWLPEQFWKDGQQDVEGLAKSYAALRAKMDAAAPKEEPKPEPAAEPKRTDGKIEKADEAALAAAASTPAATEAITRAQEEFASNAEVSEDTISQLEQAGIPRQVVELYLEGVKAQSEKLLGEIHGYVGGQDEYAKMTEWAARSLPEADIEAFNAALDNPMLRETAVLGLHAKFTKARPSEGNLMTPHDTPAAGSDIFESRDELTAAQRDPRYATDAKYREEVMAKLARSQAAGFTAFARPQFARQIVST